MRALGGTRWDAVATGTGMDGDEGGAAISSFPALTRDSVWGGKERLRRDVARTCAWEVPVRANEMLINFATGRADN